MIREFYQESYRKAEDCFLAGIPLKRTQIPLIEQLMAKKTIKRLELMGIIDESEAEFLTEKNENINEIEPEEQYAFYKVMLTLQ